MAGESGAGAVPAGTGVFQGESGAKATKSAGRRMSGGWARAVRPGTTANKQPSRAREIDNDMV